MLVHCLVFNTRVIVYRATRNHMQFPAWLCLSLFVFTYLLSCALKLNDDDDADADDDDKFHILIVICHYLWVLLYFAQNVLTEWIVYRMFFLSGNFVSSLFICMLKSKNLKTLENLKTFSLKNLGFYRTMHFSAKRGIAIACRLSVCNVGGSGSHRSEIWESNCTVT